MSEAKYTVLFVCLGNICRSPMAEAVFINEIKTRKLDHLFTIDSAGTAGYHAGDKADPRSIAKCKQHGVPVYSISRKIKKEDFYKFNYILCMDNSNLSDLNHIKPKDSDSKVELFGNYDPNKETIIKDPYYGGDDGFETNFQQTKRASIGFLKSLNLI
ncbi:LMWPc-domain-containing protein [Neoconidiobolus thromboides FSU 785]|nr:LMWPc-domain-containing protein [Neoconidiobolus thromboides FSU 785]